MPRGLSQQAAAIRVLIVQDHQLIASALAGILEGERGIVVCAIASTGVAAARIAAWEGADVVLMDFRLPDVSGPAAAAMVRASSPGSSIVFHTSDDSEESVLSAIDAGASAYLTRTATPDEIADAVRRAARGEVLVPVDLFRRAITGHDSLGARRLGPDQPTSELTPKELEVLQVLAEGLDTPAISKRLGMAQKAVEWHMRHAIEKLRVRSKLQAVVAAARQGIIELAATPRALIG
jgi:DNA-binding NarL/FixJ family response regulator